MTTTAKTFYKTKKSSSQREHELLKSPSLSTSKTDGASSLSGAKIPKMFETSKKTTENLQREGENSSQTTSERTRKRTAKEQRSAEEFARRQWERAKERVKEWAEKLHIADIICCKNTKYITFPIFLYCKPCKGELFGE